MLGYKHSGLSDPGTAPAGDAAPPLAQPPKRPAHYLWAVLIARIYEVFPLLSEEGDAQAGEGSQIGPDWDLPAQPTPDHEVDQRVNG